MYIFKYIITYIFIYINISDNNINNQRISRLLFMYAY